MKLKLKQEKIKDFGFLLNNLKQKHKEFNIPANCFFLGAGCSKSSGIPLATEIIDICKKLAFNAECTDGIDKELKETFDKFFVKIDEFVKQKEITYKEFVNNNEKRFREEINRNSISKYATLPECYSKIISIKEFQEKYFEDSLYGKWFEVFNQDKRERQRLIENIIEDKKPDGSYIIFANFIQENFIHNVFTSNFDDLLNEALIKYMDIKARVFSHNEMADYISMTSVKPNIIKLHGDYLFETIQNSNEETSILNPNMKKKLEEALCNFGLIVAGYNGADTSIISIFEEIKFKNKKDFLLIWCGNNPDNLHWRIINFINESINSYFFKVEDFETLVGRLYAELKTTPPDLIKIAEKTTENLNIYLKRFAESTKFKDMPFTEKDEINKLIEANRFFDLAYFEKDLGKQIDLYTKAIELSPNYKMAYNNRGNIFCKLNQFENGIKDFDKAIQLDPKFNLAYTNRGVAYSKRNQFEEALMNFNTAIELDPKFSFAYENRGVVFTQQNQFEIALVDFNRAIDINPNNASIYYNRGITFSKLNKLNEALDDYNKSIELNPSNALAYYGRGLIYSKKNEFEKALDDYKKSIELDPNYVESYYNRGHIYMKQNEWVNAIDDFSKAIALSPNFAKAYTNRGTVFANQNKLEKAFSDFDKAIELDPNSSDSYNYRGSIYARKNEYKKALSDFNRSIELSPNSSLAYNNRGAFYLEQNKFEKALADFDTAIELDPNYLEAYNNRGILYTKLKDYKNAQLDIERAIKFDDGNITYYFTLVELNILQEKYKIAEETLIKVGMSIKEKEDKLFFHFLKSITEKLLDKNNTESQETLTKLIEENIEISWSFDELEQFLKVNSKIDVEKRKYIEGKMRLLKGKIKK